MTEIDFKKLLIETVQADTYENKQELLDLLKLVTIRYEQTGEFTRHLWNHYKEYIQVCIIPDKLFLLKKHKEYVEKICYEIYPPNDDYELWGVEIKPGAMPNDEDISQEIIFENIRSQIIDEIRKAKYIIWVAMAWFTDPVLYDELLKKKAQGVTIELVLDNNEKNKSAEFDVTSEFPTHWITVQSYFQNIMHEKFCIIDLATTIHGTFNWTKAANYNKETISVDHNRNTSESFADEFMRLKSKSVWKR